MGPTASVPKKPKGKEGADHGPFTCPPATPTGTAATSAAGSHGAAPGGTAAAPATLPSPRPRPQPEATVGAPRSPPKVGRVRRRVRGGLAPRQKKRGAELQLTLDGGRLERHLPSPSSAFPPPGPATGQAHAVGWGVGVSGCAPGSAPPSVLSPALNKSAGERPLRLACLPPPPVPNFLVPSPRPSVPAPRSEKGKGEAERPARLLPERDPHVGAAGPVLVAGRECCPGGCAAGCVGVTDLPLFVCSCVCARGGGVEAVRACTVCATSVCTAWAYTTCVLCGHRACVQAVRAVTVRGARRVRSVCVCVRAADVLAQARGSSACRPPPRAPSPQALLEQTGQV